MILDWTGHENIKPFEQLMGIILDAGLITTEQVLQITGWKKTFFDTQLKSIRRQSKRAEFKDQWISPVYLLPDKPSVKPPCAYMLGKEGIRYISDLIEADSRIRPAIPSQLQHYLGINGILTRLLEAGVDRKYLLWYSQQEAFQMTLEYWKRFVPDSEQAKRRIIARPDAMLGLTRYHRFWIEFDNNTETIRKLENKFHRYFRTITPDLTQKYEKIISSLKYPVLWVTTSEKRKIQLQRAWETIRDSYYRKVPLLPEHIFFVQGDETQYLLERTQVPVLPVLQ